MKKIHIIFAIILLLLTGVATSLFYIKKYVSDRVKTTKQAASEARSILFDKILLDPVLVLSAAAGDTEYTARLPLRFTKNDIETIFYQLNKFSGVKTEVKEAITASTGTVIVTVNQDGEIIFKARLVKSKKPKIAIILDDWGYKSEPVGSLSSIKQPFTAAVLPGLAHSKKSAEAAKAEKKEVILHSPMQPRKNMPVEKDTIKADMSDEEITALITKQLSEMPQARGINNHEGSLVTEGYRPITAVMRLLKKENMFFVDSLTTGKSVADKRAKALGVPSAKRDIFLDNEKKEAYIIGQLMKLKKVARQRGYAIGIGHANGETLKVLSEFMPRLETEGFEFIYAAEAVY